jgi:hypothetical protein
MAPDLRGGSRIPSQRPCCIAQTTATEEPRQDRTLESARLAHALCRAGTGRDGTVRVSRRRAATLRPTRASGARLAWTLDPIDRAVKPKLGR